MAAIIDRLSECNDQVSDYSRCPACVAIGGAGLVDRAFNFAGALWAVCDAHKVRWPVTRELGGFPEVRDQPGEPLLDLPEVEGVLTHNLRAAGWR